MSQAVSPIQAIGLIPPGARIFVHGGAATPNALLREVVEQGPRLGPATMIHLHTEGPATYATDLCPSMRVINLFVGGNVRPRLDYERIDYLPCFLSEIPALFRSGRCPIDVALLHISPPDHSGYCSLGVSVDVAKAAAESARLLIAQVNPRMPRVHGHGMIHVSRFHALVDVKEELPESKTVTLSEEQIAVGRHVAGLIEDGSTLQLGIGGIPEAVARQLTGHQDLGLHTEMWSNATLALLKKGVINNRKKKFDAGLSVSSFLLGTRELYDYVDDNPSIIQRGADDVNSPMTIASHPRMMAINSAVEVDLSGQVCADSIGHKVISGIGGQMDFMRGSALSPGGKPIIAMTSLTKDQKSKIVLELRPGAGVVTTRGHVHFVVTEFGIADLWGKTLGERAKALINVAHPMHQEALRWQFLNSHSHRSSGH